MHGDSRDLPNKTNHMCFMHTHHEENVKKSNVLFIWSRLTIYFDEANELLKY